MICKIPSYDALTICISGYRWEAVIKSLGNLLIEKGLITQDEFMEKVKGERAT